MRPLSVQRITPPSRRKMPAAMPAAIFAGTSSVGWGVVVKTGPSAWFRGLGCAAYLQSRAFLGLTQEVRRPARALAR